MSDPTPLVSPGAVRFFETVLTPLERYHRFQVRGMEHIPLDGPGLLCVSHSLATYDGFIFGGAVHKATGRLPTALGDNMIFKTPWLGKHAWDAGIRPASPTAGQELLEQGYLLFLAPGGMRESLRPARERYQVRWEDRRGFVRLALRTGAPLVLCGCPAADDIFTVRASRVTDFVYRKLKAPLPVFRGLGPTLIPRPVQLTYYVAPPIEMPHYEPEREQEQVEDLHATALRVMAEQMARRD